MIQLIKKLFTKYREMILYLIFGGLTTIVSFVVYYATLWAGMHYLAAQIISWAAAVAFAFVSISMLTPNTRASLARTALCGIEAPAS